MIGMQGNTCAPVTSVKGWKKKTVVSALTRWEREVSVGDSFSYFFNNYLLLFLVLNLDSFFFLLIFVYFLFGAFSIQVGKQRLVEYVGMDERKVCHLSVKVLAPLSFIVLYYITAFEGCDYLY